MLALRNQVLNGGLPEWPMGAYCKFAGLTYCGSNFSAKSLLYTQLNGQQLKAFNKHYPFFTYLNDAIALKVSMQYFQ